MLLLLLLLLVACLPSTTTTIASVQKAVIVGGGPTGLSSALILADLGCRDITVLEKASAAVFDSEKSYLYLIDGRGQRLTKRLGITAEVAREAVSSKAFQNITVFDTTGKMQVKKVPVDPHAIEKFWLPRSALMTVLQQKVQEWGGVIKVHYNTTCSAVALYDTDGSFDRAKDRGMILVDGYNKDDSKTRCYDADLLLGCDGITSVVRRSLEDQHRSSNPQSSKRDPFSLVSLKSDSAGLNYKMLPIRYRFDLAKNSDGTKTRSEPETAYVIPSKFKTQERRLRLGLLPVKDQFVRTANIIASKSHFIWTLTNKVELKTFLRESFPQLDIDNFVEDKELDNFCQRKNGVFPSPRYSNKMYKLVGPSKNRGVVIMGDALHVFPPDLGQGVNSGFEDVVEFDHAISSAKGDLESALRSLEKTRLSEVKALCELMTFAYPYQYNQKPLLSKLWILNFGIRLVFNKMFPKVFAKSAFFLVQDHEIKYSEILTRCHQTTRRLVLGIPSLGSLLALFVIFLKKRILL